MKPRNFDEPIELQRLRKLQILIETDMWFNKRIKLDMDTWKRKEKLSNRCKTTACLCGMYAMSYPEDGLRLTPIDCFNNVIIISHELEYKRSSGFDASKRFFGLTEKENIWLFNIKAYIKEKASKKFIEYKDYRLYAIYGGYEWETPLKEIKEEALKRVKDVIKVKERKAHARQHIEASV